MTAQLLAAEQIILVSLSVITTVEWLRTRNRRSGCFAGVSVLWFVQLLLIHHWGGAEPAAMLDRLLLGEHSVMWIRWQVILTASLYMLMPAFTGLSGRYFKIKRILYIALPTLLFVLYIIAPQLAAGSVFTVTAAGITVIQLAVIACLFPGIFIKSHALMDGDSFLLDMRYPLRIFWLVIFASFLFTGMRPVFSSDLLTGASLWLHFAAGTMSAMLGVLYLFWGYTVTQKKLIESQKTVYQVFNLSEKISHDIAVKPDAGPAMEPLIEHLCRDLTAEAGVVLQFDKRSGKMVLEYMYGIYPPPQKVKVTDKMGPADIAQKFKGIKIKLEDNYMGQVYRTGEAIWAPDALQDKRIEQLFPEHFTLKSVICLPLYNGDGDVSGVFSVMNPANGSFDEVLFNKAKDYSRLTGRLLNQITLNEEMVTRNLNEKELSIAGNIQRRLMPLKLPELGRVELGAFNLQSREGGGDYYDVLSFGKEKIGVIMADIAGKGIPAALAMVTVSSVLQAFARGDVETKEVITTINKTLAMDDREERFATVFYYVFDAKNLVLNYSNAGHSPILLYSDGLDSFARLDTDGMPVGIDPAVEYQQFFTCMGNGDIIALFTDGIIEAMNENRDQYGIDRLKRIIKQNKHLSADELTDKIKKNLNEFSGDAERNDDQTLFLMKILPDQDGQ